MQNGVIEISTGNLLRKGYCDFSMDGSFDSGTESYRTDVPDDAIYRGQEGETQVSNWDGLVWSLIAQPDPSTYIADQSTSLVLKSPDGSDWAIKVSDLGMLSQTKIV